MIHLSVHFPAKIAPPVLPEVLPRERLFRVLDEARQQPVVWIAAPAGSGKTTLVGSWLQKRRLPALWYHMDARDRDCAAFFHYLSEAAASLRAPLPRFTPESRSELPFFARTYFEALFSVFPPGGVLVLENYHHIPPDSPFHRVIAEGVQVLPRDITLIVAGRAPPPPPLAHEILSRQLTLIDSAHLAFAPEEIRRAAEHLGLPLSPEQIGVLEETTGGWAAGVLLMMMAPSLQLPLHLTEAAREQVFDYFAEEVFAGIEPGVQDFLLRISWFPYLSVPSAEALTGFASAGDILARLHRQCCFTEQLQAPEPLFRFNPLFRGYLQSRAERTFPPEEILRLRRRTADLLAQMGDAEHAASISHKLKDWDALIPLLEREAEQFLARGQRESLLRWLQDIPADRHPDHPALPFFLGLLHLSSNPDRSLDCFRQAFDSAEEKEDAPLALRAWSGAVDALLLSRNVPEKMQFWLDWLKKRRSAEPFPSGAVEARVCSSLAGALSFLAPQDPALEPALRRALELTEWEADTALRLHVLRNAAHYFLWMGKTAESVMTAEALRDLSSPAESGPSFLLPWKWLEVITFFWAEGDVEKGLTSLAEYMEGVRGVEPWANIALALGVWGNLLRGDLPAAESCLKRMHSALKAENPQGHGHYHYFAAWYHLRRRQLTQARQHGEEALRRGTESGMALPTLLARLGHVQILLAAGENEEASRQLTTARAAIDSTPSLNLKYMATLTEARLALDDGRRGEGLTHLRSAFALARSQGYSYLFAWWEPEAMARLCTAALEEEIETPYVQDLVRRTGLTREDPPLHLETWPRHIRIHTFGRFALLIDGEPVRFSGKVQHKPLDLLRALVALGGRDVSAQQLCDLLWPDADGDAAQAAFATTLHRLRKLTGNDKSILLTDGKLSLDPRQCWVDAWAFERLATDAFHRWEDGNPDSREQAARATRRALRLYTGDFLSADQSSWTFRIRERLKRKMTELAGHLGTHLETSGKKEEAIKIYLHALDIDPLAEELCRRLMLCCKELGRPASALQAFWRLEAACGEAGVRVSAGMIEVFESLKTPEEPHSNPF